MLIKGSVPTPYTIVQHSFQLTFRKRKNGELLIVVYFTRLIFLVILRFSYRMKILPIVVPSYFNNKNTSFVIKFKPFPELIDILLLEQCETSGGYRHIELDGGENKC